jgi:HK97 family phage major capsid protein
VSVKTFFPRGRKAVPAGTLTGASLGDVPGFLYPAARVPGIIAPPELQPRVRDLFPVVPTGAGAVEFVRETGFVNAAAATAEGEAKPQSLLTFELVSMSARTIAHWLPATRQILADATGLQSYIDTRLLYGLMLTEDAELLYGDGTGVHIAGMLTDPNIQLYTQVAGDNKADAVRRAMTLVTIAGYPASGVIVHPNDWEDIELMKDSDGRYIWVIITVGGERRLWRAPVVESQAIHEGEFAVGAFNLAAAIWDREEALVRVSDQHEDFFTRNMMAILAEERLMLTVYRPEAIVLGSFTAAGS